MKYDRIPGHYQVKSGPVGLAVLQVALCIITVRLPTWLILTKPICLGLGSSTQPRPHGISVQAGLAG